MKSKRVHVESGRFAVSQPGKLKTKNKWQKPRLEDVSGKVMAQPYIRFT